LLARCAWYLQWFSWLPSSRKRTSEDRIETSVLVYPSYKARILNDSFLILFLSLISNE
jgi:hypothetical protein